MTFMDLSKLTFTAINAALAAGDLLRKGCGAPIDIKQKSGLHNIVTQYDHAAEEVIISTLRKEFPRHAFLAEESGSIDGAEVVWVIDPLDGTTNFAHRIPLFATSIAAVVNHTVEVGVIYLPMMHELYVAQKGSGAFLNGSRINVSTISRFQHAVGAIGFPYEVDQNAVRSMELFLEIMQKGNPMRDLGSAVINLAYLAAGRVDAFWNASLQPWDFAAGKLIVEEAGGKVTCYNNTPLDLQQACSVIATNGHLHKELSSYLTTK